MDFMIVVPYVTRKGKMSSMLIFDDLGQSRFVDVASEATREEWLQKKKETGNFAIVGECLVHLTVLHTMGIAIDEQGETVATLPLKGDKLATIPLKGGEVKIHS